MPELDLLTPLLTIAAVMAVVLSFCGLLIYVERKVAAFVQDRLGPNRVGPFGLLQSLADGLKFILKEDVIPSRVDKVLYLLAPALAVSTALLAFAVVPFGPTTPAPRPPAALVKDATPEMQKAHQARVETYQQEAVRQRASYQFVIAPNVDVGILFIFAIGSLNVYGVILGGWAANSKYSLLGGLRSSAQIVSYEIPLGLSVVGVVLMSGGLNLERIIDAQWNSGPGVWFILLQPLAFLLFLIGAFAECNRLPFDLPEAEQELVGGYHTEYSAMKFALFFLAEYTHMVTTSFLTVILFFGGWHLPWVSAWAAEMGLLGVAVNLAVFAGKMTVFILFYMMIRWTIPRFRFDQLMGLAWKVLIPLALFNLLGVMVVKEFAPEHLWLLPLLSIGLVVGAGAVSVTPKKPPPMRYALDAAGHPIHVGAR